MTRHMAMQSKRWKTYYTSRRHWIRVRRSSCNCIWYILWYSLYESNLLPILQHKEMMLSCSTCHTWWQQHECVCVSVWVCVCVCVCALGQWGTHRRNILQQACGSPNYFAAVHSPPERWDLCGHRLWQPDIVHSRAVRGQQHPDILTSQLPTGLAITVSCQIDTCTCTPFPFACHRAMCVVAAQVLVPKGRSCILLRFPGAQLTAQGARRTAHSARRMAYDVRPKAQGAQLTAQLSRFICCLWLIVVCLADSEKSPDKPTEIAASTEDLARTWLCFPLIYVHIYLYNVFASPAWNIRI